MYRLMNGNHVQRTALSLIEIQRLYNRGQISISDVLRKETEQEWRLVGDVLGESLMGSVSRARSRRATIPQPPLVSWGMVLFIGCISGGLGLGVIGLLQGFWSRKLSAGLMPIVWSLCAVVLPVAHLIWSFSLMQHEHAPLLAALVHIVVGIITVDIIGYLFATFGALSIRKALLQRFADKGFTMGFLLTLILGPVYVAYKAEELKRLHE